MNKKKLVIMASTLIVAAAAVAGGTLAYFTHSVDVTNTLTTGNVKISIAEPSFKEINAVNVTPGREIPKDPTITNIGDNNCLLRVKLDATLTDKNNNPSPLTVDAAKLVELLPGWTKGVGNGNTDYYYYNTILAKGDKATVFNKMVVPSEWDNKYQGLTLKLKVTAHAIQADNFKPQVNSSNKIIGWSDVVVEN